MSMRGRQKQERELAPFWSVIRTIFFGGMLLGLEACLGPRVPFSYKPNPMMEPPPQAKYRAAVAFAENESKPGMAYDARGQGWTNLSTLSGKSAVMEHFEETRVSPKVLTDMIVQDLAASGLFTSVDHEGVGPSDISIKTTIKEAYVVNTDPIPYHWTIDIQALKDNHPIFSKEYRKRWDSDARTYKGLMEDYSDHWRDWMRELRSDLAKALEEKR